MMNAPRHSSRLRQRGIVSIVAAIILFAGVIFVLGQTLGIIGTTSNSNQAQGDSVAAFFLAESGLERGQGILNAASDPAAASACTGITGSFTLGRGTFSLSSTSTPTGCTTACTGCAITSTGTMGSSSRTVTRAFTITPGTLGGVSCNSATTNCTNLTAPPPTWFLNVTNTTAQPALALLHLAATRQGNPSAANCTAQSNCNLKWVINSQNGNDSVVSMGNLYSLDVGTQTGQVYQTIVSSRPEDVAFSAILLPGNTNPAMIGAYWDDTQNGSGGTHGKEHDNGGTTNNGAATSSGNCTTNPAPAPSTTQACTNWCYGGDRLVFGFAGAGNRENAVADMLTSVTFNTNGNPSQNIALSRISHFPTPSTPGATLKVFSELWSAYNANLPDVTAGHFIVGSSYMIKTIGTTDFTLIGAANNTVGITFVATGAGSGTGIGTGPGTSPIAANASSYKGNGTGAIGALLTASTSGNTLTVTAAPGYPSRIIYPGVAGTGDTLSSSGGGANVTGNPTITSQVTPLIGGESLGGIGRYIFNGSSQTVSSRSMTSSSKILHVTACTICFFAPTDPVVGTAYTISSQLSGTTGGVGDYLLSGTSANGTTVISAAVLAGTPGATIYLPSTQSMPAVTTPNTRITIFSGTGVFAANTTVTAVTSPAPNAATNSFTVSAPTTTPTTALNNATICGGTCAFFDHTSATTNFSIVKPTETDSWASGFICVSGADLAPVIGSTGSAPPKATTWRELVK